MLFAADIETALLNIRRTQGHARDISRMGTHGNASDRVEDDLSEVARRLRSLYLSLQAIQIDGGKALAYHRERNELRELE